MKFILFLCTLIYSASYAHENSSGLRMGHEEEEKSIAIGKKKGGAPTEKSWKCPYCSYHWELGEQCKNDNCPTNRWKKEETSTNGKKDEEWTEASHKKKYPK